ncbi:MAG: hypothetical protein R3182_15245 [Draconibacterium sp.]|nr:hypothetical protein [Draconibacterium sp.]
MLGAAILVVPVMSVPYFSSLAVAVGLIAIAAAAHCAYTANLFTVISDLFPKNVVGSVTGFGTTVSTLWGMLTALLIGKVLETAGPEGYKIAFAVASCGYLIAVAVIHILVPKMKPIEKI